MILKTKEKIIKQKNNIEGMVRSAGKEIKDVGRYIENIGR